MTNVTGATGRFKDFDIPNIPGSNLGAPKVDNKVDNNYPGPNDWPTDSFTPSTPKENTMKIGFFRLAFRRLRNDQIEEVNKTGKLPKNAKFIRKGNDYQVANDIFHITQGTKTLPAGYEVRKSIFGFTKVVPKDSQGLFLKSNAPKAKKEKTKKA